MQSRPSFYDLASETQIHLFGFLTFKERRQIETVSISWRQLLNDKYLMLGFENVIMLKQFISTLKEKWLCKLFLNEKITKEQAIEVSEILERQAEEADPKRLLTAGVITEDQFEQLSVRDDRDKMIQILWLRTSLRVLLEKKLYFEDFLELSAIVQFPESINAVLNGICSREKFLTLSEEKIKLLSLRFEKENHGVRQTLNFLRNQLKPEEIIAMPDDNFERLEQPDVFDSLRRGFITTDELIKRDNDEITKKAAKFRCRKKFIFTGTTIGVSVVATALLLWLSGTLSEENSPLRFEKVAAQFIVLCVGSILLGIPLYFLVGKRVFDRCYREIDLLKPIKFDDDYKPLPVELLFLAPPANTQLALKEDVDIEQGKNPTKGG